MSRKKEVKQIITKDYIICPHCKAQYHPAEIFDARWLLGKPKNVIKDPENKIIYVEWSEDGEPVTKEKYVCDFCGKVFEVQANLTYTSSPVKEEEDFTINSTSLI